MGSKLMQLAIDQIRSDLEIGDVAPLQVLLQKLYQHISIKLEQVDLIHN